MVGTSKVDCLVGLPQGSSPDRVLASCKRCRTSGREQPKPGDLARVLHRFAFPRQLEIIDHHLDRRLAPVDGDRQLGPAREQPCGPRRAAGRRVAPGGGTGVRHDHCP